MGYPLTLVPYSITTADGFLPKQDKAKAFQFLTKDCIDADVPLLNETLTVDDGNACLYHMKVIPHSFRQICLKVFDVIRK